MESEKTNSLLLSDLNKYIEELKKAKENPELASKAKSEFFASINHELRSPLNAILGYVQIINRSNDLPAHHRKNLEMISQSGEYLLSLIDQVMSLVEVDINKIGLEENNFSVITLLEEPKNFDKEGIKTLPKELLQKFTHAIKMGDLELIEEINLEITRINSNIGNHFTKLAEDYELDHLMELVKNS